MSQDWDVDSYRTEHENEEHWELRRNFMLAHKDKFSEDELVCLAQVFTNIEFMGCRYPDKTMIRVAELAKGVVEKFREQRKNSLKRTFVAASDAATAKVKGQKVGESGPPKKISFVEATNTEEVITVDDKVKETNKPNSRVAKYGGVKTFTISETQEVQKSSINKPEGPFGELVLIMDSEGNHAAHIIHRSAVFSKCPIKWEFEEGRRVCKLFIKDTLVSVGTGATKKMSKEMAAEKGLEKLRESCYGIKIKSKFCSSTTVDPSELKPQTSSNALGEDNIGRKLLKMMGWQGGGLGKEGQGREEPVTAVVHVSRDGFGVKRDQNMAEFRKQAKQYIKTWMQGNSDQDLVFSTNFNSDERKVMHELAKSFSLKSKSYGKNDDRQLVISRKSGPWEILEELVNTGGSSDKYELVYPTKT